MLDNLKYLYITLLILYVYNYDNVYIIAIGIKIYIMYFTTSGYNAIQCEQKVIYLSMTKKISLPKKCSWVKWLYISPIIVHMNKQISQLNACFVYQQRTE